MALLYLISIAHSCLRTNNYKQLRFAPLVVGHELYNSDLNLTCHYALSITSHSTLGLGQSLTCTYMYMYILYFTFYSWYKQRKEKDEYNVELTNNGGSQSNGSTVNGRASTESRNSPSENAGVAPSTNSTTPPLNPSPQGDESGDIESPLLACTRPKLVSSSPQPSSPPAEPINPHQPAQQLERGDHYTPPTQPKPEASLQGNLGPHPADSNMLQFELESSIPQPGPSSLQEFSSQLESVA